MDLKKNYLYDFYFSVQQQQIQLIVTKKKYALSPINALVFLLYALILQYLISKKSDGLLT